MKPETPQYRLSGEGEIDFNPEIKNLTPQDLPFLPQKVLCVVSKNIHFGFSQLFLQSSKRLQSPEIYDTFKSWLNDYSQEKPISSYPHLTELIDPHITLNVDLSGYTVLIHETLGLEIRDVFIFLMNKLTINRCPKVFWTTNGEVYNFRFQDEGESPGDLIFRLKDKTGETIQELKIIHPNILRTIEQDRFYPVKYENFINYCKGK